jgi:hypothetical protein
LTAASRALAADMVSVNDSVVGVVLVPSVTEASAIVTVGDGSSSWIVTICVVIPSYPSVDSVSATVKDSVFSSTVSAPFVWIWTVFDGDMSEGPQVTVCETAV